MATRDALSCLVLNGNTGVGKCFLDPKNIIGAFLCPKGYEFDVTDPQTTLIAATHNASKLARIYPIYDFLAPKDSSEQKTIQTFPTGAKKVVREGYNDWGFQYVQGGLDLLKQLRKFNGSSYDFLFVDANGLIIGIAGSTGTKIKAVPSDGGYFWAESWKVNDGSKIAEYMIQFVFHVRYLTDFIATVVTGIDLPTVVKGLQDVVLTAETGGTPGIYKVTAKTLNGANLADLYPVELAVTAIWKPTNFTTAGGITVTAVAVGKNAAGESCFILTLDTADPDYPGVGGFVNHNLDTPAAMQALGVDGYESTGPVKIAKN